VSDNINRLLIVDGDNSNVVFVTAAAEELGFSVATAAAAPELLRLVDTFRPTLIVVDLHLPQGDGVEILRLLVARDCRVPVVLMSGADRRVVSTTYDLGVSRGLQMAGTLSKPVAPRDLQSLLTSVLIHDREISVADLDRALDTDELVAYFQPKASLAATGGWRIDAMEALVRWQHPSLGIVMPDEFIPLAERSGRIGRLTDHVLEHALTALRDWTEMGLDLKCAVNLPPTLVTDLQFPDRIAGLIADYGLDGSQLTLELTETATMQDPMRTMDILTRLRVKQVGLSLDDFGTGFSSLTRLYQMPFDEMKIDKSLVVNVPRSREANTMVGSLIELGHNLGLKICAEGVESRAALDLLEILGCDRVQGFFISRALPASEIPTFVTRWNQQSPASSMMKVPNAVI
jgi:EAL domain-containing protein (putative c-di-GMP-specific phosphodiesterase class I)